MPWTVGCGTRSLDAVNVAEITAQAGVTRSAFYFYFENKAAAVGALMERLVTEIFTVNEEFTTGGGAPRDARLHHAQRPVRQQRPVSPCLQRDVGGAWLQRHQSEQIWDDARDAFTPSVAELIRAQRPGNAPEPEVLAAVLLEFNDRMLERFIVGGQLARAPADRGCGGGVAEHDLWRQSMSYIGTVLHLARNTVQRLAFPCILAIRRDPWWSWRTVSAAPRTPAWRRSRSDSRRPVSTCSRSTTADSVLRKAIRARSSRWRRS